MPHHFRASRRPRISATPIGFALGLMWIGLIAHAAAYLSHEYAHSFSAWAMGWMANPLALDYGDWSLYNVIFLGNVDDNVDYTTIFAAGHGTQAALIALAGPMLGNGLLYGILYRVARSRLVARQRFLSLCIYELALMCAGNVWSYVPIRTITSHADIALAARGLGWPDWLLGIPLLAVSLAILLHFFSSMFRSCHVLICKNDRNHLMLLIVTTCFWYFSFFGGDGIHGSYGAVSEWLSIASLYLLFPLSAMYLLTTYLDGPAGRPYGQTSAEPSRADPSGKLSA